MDQQLLISAVMIVITTLIHGVFIAVGAVILRPISGKVPVFLRFFRDLLVLVMVGLGLMLAHFLEIAVWAKAFVYFEVLPNFETALYFASVSYTTLGHGGLEIAQEWRLLAGASAANGFLLFGMSAAFLMDVKKGLGLNKL